MSKQQQKKIELQKGEGGANFGRRENTIRKKIRGTI